MQKEWVEKVNGTTRTHALERITRPALLELLVDGKKLGTLVLLDGVPGSRVLLSPNDLGAGGQTAQVPAGTDNDTSDNNIDWDGLNGKPVLHKRAAEVLLRGRHGGG